MDKLVKKGDTRHLIDIPATRDVEAKAGNIFGVAFEGAIDPPPPENHGEDKGAAAPANAPSTAPSVAQGERVGLGVEASVEARPKKRFSWMRMPLFVRLWGRS